jgi:hypothetical protein
MLYDGVLQPGWQESGSAVRQLDAGAPAYLVFGDRGEWVLSHPGPLPTDLGALLFRVKEPEGEGEFLEICLGTRTEGAKFRGVKIKPDHRTEVGNGWTQVSIPILELNPNGAVFDEVIFRPFRPFSNEAVLLDKIALAKASAGPLAGVAGHAQGPAPNGRSVQVRLACESKPARISPYIYGIAFGEKGWADLGVTARRFGGNGTTRFNWENSCSNKASDWFFENGCGGSYTEFLDDSDAHAVPSAMSIPMLGWAAKDGTSYSFPVSVYGPQSKTDPWHPDVGNGVAPSGQNIPPGPPTRTSVPTPPDWAKRWVAAIRARDAQLGRKSIYEYILDNEPMLWSTTHRDVHPEPVGYDELLDRTIQYASAIREADPQATIAGPAEWGWSNYLFSAKDLSGRFGMHMDRRAHGDVPLVEWYLRKLREYEQKTGTRPLDVLDLHYYPQGNNVYGGGAGGSDRDTQLLRLRQTRSLWDPSYVDESWINDRVRLLPRMREWVDRNYPGRGISIGEWNFGGEKDVTGGLATAEAIGRFAQFGVTSAFYWTAPAVGSSSAFAFLAYRNFDGKGGHFQDWFVPSTAADGLSVFASRDSDGKHIVVVALNLLPETPLTAELDVSPCGTLSSYQAYEYTTGASAFTASGVEKGVDLQVQRLLPPWSISVLDIRLVVSRGALP